VLTLLALFCGGSSASGALQSAGMSTAFEK
jgi:hypothetical protein